MDVKDVIHSTTCWFIGAIALVFLFLIFAARPALHLLGLLFQLLGGVGLEGTDL